MKTSTDSGTSLDDRIRQAERRLVERELRVRQQLGSARTQIKAAAQPARWLAPVLGLATAGVVFKLLRRRYGRHRAAALQQRYGGPVAVLPQRHWGLSLLGTALPIVLSYLNARTAQKAARGDR